VGRHNPYRTRGSARSRRLDVARNLVWLFQASGSKTMTDSPDTPSRSSVPSNVDGEPCFLQVGRPSRWRPPRSGLLSCTDVTVG